MEYMGKEYTEEELKTLRKNRIETLGEKIVYRLPGGQLIEVPSTIDYDPEFLRDLAELFKKYGEEVKGLEDYKSIGGGFLVQYIRSDAPLFNF